MRVFLLPALAVTLLTSCYTTNNPAKVTNEARKQPPSIEQLRTHTFAADKGATYDAIIALMFEDGLVPETADRQSGLISSGWNSGGGILLTTLAGNYRYRHSFLVSQHTTDSSRVTYTLNLEMGNGAQWQAISPSRRNYSGISEFWQRVQRTLSE